MTKAIDPPRSDTPQPGDQPYPALLKLVSHFATTDFESSDTQTAILGAVCQAVGAQFAALGIVMEQDLAQVRWQLSGTNIPREGMDWTEELSALASRAMAEGRHIQSRGVPGESSGSGPATCTMLCAPLVAEGRALGAILICDPPDTYTTDFDPTWLDALAAWLAGELLHTRQVKALRSANASLETRRLELLHSRNTLRALFDSVPTSMYIVDAGYTLLAINKSRAGLAGAIPQQLVSRRCYSVLFQRNKPCADCRVGETFGAGIGTRRVERRSLTSGNIVEYEITSFPIHNEGGKVSQVILFEDDVTEKRRLEVSLAQAEKLAAVGQLAAGVAHEINNPLTAVIANAQLLRRELDDAELKDMAALIQQAGERASGVVRELLDLSRQEPLNLTPMDVNETLRRALALVQPRLAAGEIRLSFTPQAELPPVIGIQEQLQGVWLNLLINAMDAFQGEGGEIRVTSRRDGSRVFVSVSDNGQGIPPEYLGRIFEPFFTTKEPGHGTGLGLSIGYRVIRQIGGDMQVESQPGVGTTFFVSLPVA